MSHEKFFAKFLLLAAAASSAISISGMASAADMAVKARPVVPPPVLTTWTGCYVGVEGGWNGGRGGITTGPVNGPPSITNGFDLSGGLAGGTLGCQYQWNHWVFGAEGDISWTNKSGSSQDIPPYNVNFSNALNEQWIATFRGRVGYLPVDSLLLYVTGGGAVASVKQTVQDNPPVCGPGTAFPCVAISETSNMTGWTAGVGGEYRFSGNWSVKAEYLYVGFSQKSYFNPAPLSPSATFLNDQRANLHDNIVRVGVNYKFDWAGPVVAKY
jgi:outer membrane immunogenic protein